MGGGLKSFGSALKDIADAVSTCGVQDLAKIIEDAAPSWVMMPLLKLSVNPLKFS